MEPLLLGVPRITLAGVLEDPDKSEMLPTGRETSNTVKETNRASEGINSIKVGITKQHKEATGLLQATQDPEATDLLLSNVHPLLKILNSVVVLDSRDPRNLSLQDVKPVLLLSTNMTDLECTTKELLAVLDWF